MSKWRWAMAIPAVAAALAVFTSCGVSRSGHSPTTSSSPAPTARSARPGGLMYPVSPISNAGRWLTDAQGRVVDLHGVNVVAKDAPYYPSAFGFSDADAAFLASRGLRVVRLGVLASGEMPTEGKIDEGYIDQLVSTVDELGRHHIYSLLDWHQDDYGTFFDEPGTIYRADGFPRWMTVTDGKPNTQVAFPLDYGSDPALKQAFQSFWNDARVPGGQDLQSYAIEMFQAVAKKVKSNPWVLGYELMNEPWPGNVWLPCLAGSGCSQLEATELEPYYSKAAKAIRAIDPTHMIFMEPFVTFNFGLSQSALAMPSGVANTTFAFHQYAQVQSLQKQVFANAVAWSTNGGSGALFNTEWSTLKGEPASIVEQADLEDQYLMPWTYWIFGSCDIACSPNSIDDLVVNERLAPSGTNVNSSIADALTRPYPLAVAGTPVSLSYDTSGHVMTFTWSTSKAGSSSRFGQGSISSFAAPSEDYPQGYSVKVSDAKVISQASASTLEVEQLRSTTTLTLTLSPAS